MPGGALLAREEEGGVVVLEPHQPAAAAAPGFGDGDERVGQVRLGDGDCTFSAVPLRPPRGASVCTEGRICVIA